MAKSQTVLGIRAEAPRPTALAAAIVATMACLPLLVFWALA
ncbi:MULTISPECIES: hypothetical protein [Loktanella]|nr:MULTISPECIES: hypothetical protein [Loktanella]